MDRDRSVGYIARMVSGQETFQMALPTGLRVGTSSWSTASWHGVFYSDRCRAGNTITEYSRVFDPVEIDSTFYEPPGRRLFRDGKKRPRTGFSPGDPEGAGSCRRIKPFP